MSDVLLAAGTRGSCTRWVSGNMRPEYVKLLAEIRRAFAMVRAGALRPKKWVREGASSYTVPVKTAHPCGVNNCCAADYPHTHAPDTGWIRPDSWDYENSRPRT